MQKIKAGNFATLFESRVDNGIGQVYLLTRFFLNFVRSEIPFLDTNLIIHQHIKTLEN